MRDSQEFPEAGRPGLAVWREVVEEIHAAHPGRGDRMPPLNGRGHPVGPKRWGDGHGAAWKVFIVLFLPGPDDNLINHNLSVEFAPNGRPRIVGGNHLGGHFEIRRTREQALDVGLFAADLRAVARLTGLLPAEPDAGPVVAAALEWQRLVEDLGAPAERIRPALQRLDGAVSAYRGMGARVGS